MANSSPHAIIIRIEGSVYEQRADGSYHPTSKHTTNDFVSSEAANLADAIEKLRKTIKGVKDVNR